MQTLGHFDSTVKAEEEAKANKDPNTTYVSDIDELYDILGDQIKKRKVGTVLKASLLSRIIYINNMIFSFKYGILHSI